LRHIEEEGTQPQVEQGEFRIAGSLCKVVCVDNVLPQHDITRPGACARLIYAEGEIAHFEFGGHIFALLVLDQQEGGAAVAKPPAAENGAELPQNVCDLLTNRELQIVQLICMGCLTKQVADRLRLSEFTVRSYLKTIYCKLGVRSRGAMVYRYAQAAGAARPKRV
jgi:DNA-binding CsgD family transcriptional regulator